MGNQSPFLSGQIIEKQDQHLTQQEGSSKYVGLGDIYLDVVNTTILNSDLKIHYGLSTGLSLGNKKTSTENINGNLYSGGMSLIPYVGLTTALESEQFVGAKIAYDFKMSRKEEAQSNTPVTINTLTGKNISSLEGFYEYHSSGNLVGITVGMNSISSSIRKYELETQGEEMTGSYLQFPVAVYGTYFINPDLAVLGQYKYITSSDHDITNVTGNINNRISKNSENQFQISLRYEF